ncbi:MAG: DUF1446 domain-containing protein [Alphaproteobacteria bacterium]
MTDDRIVRIGCASGFWGDSAVAAPQLVRGAEIDYLIVDYLAEVTMSILARARAKDPKAGYAVDFVTVAMRSVIRDLKDKKIRVVSNAGGMNPRACAQAVEALAAEAGVSLKVAAVEGDDLLDRAGALKQAGAAEMFSGAPFPEGVMSINAYLGAFPIAAALDDGADIVVTGRAVDSAMALGPLIHAFGWGPGDLDQLAQGSLAGHILECGAQATGGLHTDWQDVPDWANIGYPIAECEADGAFTVTKPEGTGGLVAPQVVAEQMLYEVGDPATYILPDVVCDFTDVTMAEAGDQRVRVAGAKGRAATDSYKVSATYLDGYRATGMLTVIGRDAVAKAERTAEAVLARSRAIFRHMNLGDFSDTHTEILGAESAYGPHARAGARASREAVMRLTVAHPERKALEIFAGEVAPAGTSWSPGTTGFSGRPKVQPKVRLFSFLIPKDAVAVTVTANDASRDVALETGGNRTSDAAPARSYGDDLPALPGGERVELPLAAIAWGRSGDKGDSANIGIIARDPAFVPLIRDEVTAARVKDYFAYMLAGNSEVTRFDVPGIGGFNFLLTQALGGGGMASLRNDPLAKGLAQMLLDLPVSVPAEWVEAYKLSAD